MASSNSSQPQSRSPSLHGVSPDSLNPSQHHVRGRIGVTDAFVRSVNRVGLIEPPICRHESGELRVVDGVRRVEAATRAGLDEIPVIVYNLTDAEAVEFSLTLNIDVWNKSVSERDKERAMRRLVGGPPRQIQEWEKTDDLFEAKYELGMVDDANRMERVVRPISGVGAATALSLATVFETPDAVKTASVSDLTEVPGIGPKTAQRIHEYFTPDVT